MPHAQLNGTRLYYEVAGEGEPVLFIHGLGSSTRDWEFQVPDLSRSYRVITFDLRGHGQSDKPQGPYSMAGFAKDAVDLLRSLGVEKAHIVGISLGGGIAFQLAADCPEVAKTLVIVNSGPALIVKTLKDKINIWQRFAIVRLMGMRKMGQVLSERLFPKPEHAQLRANFVERWAENDPRAYLDTLRAMVNWSVLDKLPDIKCPTLVIAADQDYTPLALKEAYVKLMPNAEIRVITDAHHATPGEKPEEFNAVLREFLAKHS